MVITIRLRDLVLIFITVILWSLDHWFTSEGILFLCNMRIHNTIFHAAHCLGAVVLLGSAILFTYECYRYSILYGFFGIFYMIYTALTAFFWNYLLQSHHGFFALLVNFLLFFITISMALFIFKRNKRLFFSILPINIWRGFLFFVNILFLV